MCIEIDSEPFSRANARRASATTSRVDVPVIATHEEAVIARATQRLTDADSMRDAM
jgi:acetate kinase